MSVSIVDKLKLIIDSEYFKKGLAEVNEYFPNVKQEIHIRDLLLKLYNKHYADTYTRAFAEIKSGTKRIDFGVLKHNQNKPEFLAELKFQYPGDFNREADWNAIINNDYISSSKVDTSIDLFILIVLEWENLVKRQNFESSWGIPKLSRYCGNLKNDWKTTVTNYLKIYGKVPEESDLVEIPPLQVDDNIYHFFLLHKKAKAEAGKSKLLTN